MSEFVPGQRWVVDSEPELGLGTVISTEGRTVRIFFEQGQCERNYATAQAPLTRIQYAIDDEIETNEGERGLVNEVHEHQGLMFYVMEGSDKIIPESQLSSDIRINQPYIRLITGQVDKPAWFNFKRDLNHAISRLWRSRLNGLLGIRANLIPHQLYVAWKACEREDVRVLLADEVGLGKTIEAGMILSRLTKLERIQRALIVVPSALQVQWLVELVRRFSLNPELFKGAEHDFNSGQITIIPHEVLGEYREALEESDFDLLIVDEAHHITPGSAPFMTLENLSLDIRHLVLLTATPEQLGMESHFARLRLLDPAKFNKIEDFVAQESQYIQLNQDIRALPGSRDKIISDYDLDISSDDDDETLIAQVLDSHGVGRVMFRNVRSAVAGFPVRVAHTHILEEDDWLSKFECLAQLLKANPDEKVLAIVHDIDHVFACEDYLWKKHGLDAAVFHEEQNLIDRDKAAAYFADDENGAQVLICSEIGSEGRNFQFSANLVCLDLPEHPDLLEQRIGRLDRIGQSRDVNIHLLFSEGSASHTQYRWFHEILDCVEQQNPAAGIVHDKYWSQLKGSLDDNALLEEAQNYLSTLREEIKQGRDALLEMNSCRQPQADELSEKIAAFENETPKELVETASELLQFYFEETRIDVYSIIPSDKMLIPALPGVPPEGCEITFCRDVANQREDVKFVSWDAPLVQGLWDLLQYSELGCAAVAMLPSRQLPAGRCLVEACFDILIQSEHNAEIRPFLPSMNIRTLSLDMSENDLSDALPEKALQNSIQDVQRHLAREIIKSQKDEIPNWYKKSEQLADKKKEGIIEEALACANAYFDQEINRLKQLKKRNPLVDESEIESLQEKASAIEKALKTQTHAHLSAIRLIVITDGK